MNHPTTTPSSARPLRALAACVLGAACLSGCVDTRAVEQVRADAMALRERLDERARHWDEALAGVPEGDPIKPHIEAEAAQAQAALGALDAGIARIDQVLAEAAKPTDPLTETVGAASPLVPPPVRGPLMLGAAALVVGLRAWRLKAGLTSVARGIQVAMREDEEFRTCFRKHADTFRATQTPTAKRVIDGVTGRPPLVPLPL